MTKKVLLLPGWAQNSGSLVSLFNDSSGRFFIDDTNYLDHSSFTDFTNKVRGRDYDLLIGWSLGGQIALRLLNELAISTKSLVLLATPFDFIDLQFEQKQKTDFADFYNLALSAPNLAIKRLIALSALNDDKQQLVIEEMTKNKFLSGHLPYWLNELKDFSCRNINFSKIPATLIIQGKNDAVVCRNQLEYFKKSAINAQYIIINGCGHAPQISAKQQVQEIIQLCL